MHFVNTKEGARQYKSNKDNPFAFFLNVTDRTIVLNL